MRTATKDAVMRPMVDSLSMGTLPLLWVCIAAPASAAAAGAPAPPPALATEDFPLPLVMFEPGAGDSPELAEGTISIPPDVLLPEGDLVVQYMTDESVCYLPVLRLRCCSSR